MNEPVCIELLGGLRIRRGDRVISRFRTQKTAALLAYMACFLGRNHAREEIVELLWPEDDSEDGKRSLRVALSSLRKQLEPPGTPFNSVLVTDRQSIRLNRQVVSTDAAEFECAVRAAEEIADPAAHAVALRKAVDLYVGPFLPGFYDDWAVRERDRLERVCANTLGKLPGALVAVGELGSAIDYALRRVGIDSLSDEAHCELIRLLIEDRQHDAARSRYDDMARLFRAELDAAPSAAAQALVSALPDTRAARGPRSQAAVTVPVSLPARTLAHGDGPAPRDSPRLPLYLTPFFGREDEMAKLRAHLAHGVTAPAARLLTLTGPGGSGKTRLAIEAARGLADAFDGRTWFVPLADADAADLIPDAILRAMDLPRDPGLRPMDQVFQALPQDPALLLLDNFEQFAETGAEVVWALLERCPHLACLVTSRQRLDLPGEREIPVAPLTAPTVPGVPERLMEFPSVSLFVDRAQMARPDFQITRDNAAAIAAICARLDGIPLAIELAASWSGVLTPAQMLSRLEERLALESRRKGGPARQRSLRETIDWSYRLLTPELQRVFAVLSVFRGGWSLEAAEAACDEPTVLDRLQELRERSLVVAEESGSEMRFRLLETLREFAWERLGESGQREAARERHLAYFLVLMEEEGARIGGADQAAALRRLETEHDNLREALRTSVDSRAAESESSRREVGMRLAVALTPFWDLRGYQAEGRRWLQALLDGRGEATDLWRARALCAAGTLAWQQADYAEARKLLEESLAIWRELGERAGLAASLNTLANVLADQSEYAAARIAYEESLSLRREAEDRRGIASSLNNLGIVSLELGDYAGARTLLEESLAIRRELADMRGTATCLNNLGDVTWRGGEIAAARSLYEEALTIRRQLGDRRGIASSLSHLANLLAGTNDFEAAQSLYSESLKILRDLADKRGITGCLEEIAGLAARQGRAEPAARLFGAAERLREMMDAPLPPVEQAAHRRKIASLWAALPRDQLDALWQEGRDMPLDDAIDLALTNRLGLR